jgi:hypothetical protein
VQVISGAGEFEITFERVEVRDGTLVLIGKMGVWESETWVSEADLGPLLRMTLRPRVLGWALARPFAALRRRLRRDGA